MAAIVGFTVFMIRRKKRKTRGSRVIDPIFSGLCGKDKMTAGMYKSELHSESARGELPAEHERVYNEQQGNAEKRS